MQIYMSHDDTMRFSDLFTSLTVRLRDEPHRRVNRALRHRNTGAVELAHDKITPLLSSRALTLITPAAKLFHVYIHREPSGWYSAML